MAVTDSAAAMTTRIHKGSGFITIAEPAPSTIAAAVHDVGNEVTRETARHDGQRNAERNTMPRLDAGAPQEGQSFIAFRLPAWRGAPKSRLPPRFVQQPAVLVAPLVPQPIDTRMVPEVHDDEGPLAAEEPLPYPPPARSATATRSFTHAARSARTPGCS